MRLTQEYANEKLDVLEEWLGQATDRAQTAEDTWTEAEAQMARMTPEEREAFWALFERSKSVLLDQGHRMIWSRTPLDRGELEGPAALVFLRTLIDYDRERGELSGALWALSRPHWRHYFRGLSSQGTSHMDTMDRLLRELSAKMATHEGRDARIEEQVEYLQENHRRAHDRSKEQVEQIVRSIRRRRPDRSLSESIGGEDERELSDVLPSEPSHSVDTEEIGGADRTGGTV
jgi:hypothetical protein